MLAELDTYDWKQVFEYGTPHACKKGHQHGLEPVIGEQVSLTPFTREDVEDILHMEEGDNDGPEWVGVFLLKDGRFAAIRAGCDYTGWG